MTFKTMSATGFQSKTNREKWTKKLEKGINRISIRIDFSHVLKKAPDPNDDFLKKIEEDYNAT